ncbi:unnamed protein product [Paramecium octaurelia]|uniref:Transmembrane protein n=1 Tax=Paramecium octaurelia TaxID=43137 RepID=A0A8S1Y527_PAROT|nr:unnamed protein product [Paramecium octaurelia]
MLHLINFLILKSILISNLDSILSTLLLQSFVVSVLKSLKKGEVNKPKIFLKLKPDLMLVVKKQELCKIISKFKNSRIYFNSWKINMLQQLNLFFQTEILMDIINDNQLSSSQKLNFIQILRQQMKKNIKNSRTYQKISDEQKKKLLKLVCLLGFKIKAAAKKLKLKYAAAKTYIIYYRNNVMRSKIQINSKLECQIAPLSSKKCKLNIVSKLGGDVVGQLQFEYPTMNQE